MNQLEFFFKENHDRWMIKWSNYFEVYDRHFQRFKNQEVHVLEIGVNQGGSLRMWREYFGPQAKVYGIDVDYRCKNFEEPGIEIFIGSQEDRAFLRNLKKRLPRIDILIDDGGHTVRQQIVTFEEMFPYVSETGVYLCEDLHTSYWPSYGGGYREPGSFVEYSKQFIDALNAWLANDEGLAVSGFTRSAHSVHYYSSILVIEKQKMDTPKSSATGRRSYNLGGNRSIEDLIAEAQKAVWIDAASATAYRNLGDAYLEAGLYPKAVLAYQQSAEIEVNPASYVGLAQAQMALQQYDEAAAGFRKAIALDAKYPFWICLSLVYVALGDALRQNQDLDGAIAAYQQAIRLESGNADYYAKLGAVQSAKQDFKAAAQSYRKRVELRPRNFQAYQQLVKILPLAKASKQEIIEVCKAALQIRANSPNLHARLANLYYRTKQYDQAIASCREALRLRSGSFPAVQKLLEKALHQSGQSAAAASKDETCEVTVDDATGAAQTVWKRLNQVDFRSHADHPFPSLPKFSKPPLTQHFAEISQYRFINLSAPSEDDQQYLNKLGLSLSYLRENFAETPGADLDDSLKKIRRSLARVQLAIDYQLPAIQQQAVTAICPRTGERLSSNRSFHCLPMKFAYRFESSEVFYLITGDVWAEKIALFFPQTDLIVTFFIEKRGIEKRKTEALNALNALKAFMVLNREKVAAYLCTAEKPKTAVLIKTSHFAHHFWNELTGIHRLCEANLLDQVDQFFVTEEPMGNLDQMFAEIPPEKITRTQLSEVGNAAIEHNYFFASLGGCLIKEDLANRLYQYALGCCSPTVKTEIDAARSSHFPLLWVSLRVGSRTWLSQTSGIAKIANRLAEQFPSLGLVIDGFSLPENCEDVDVYQEYIQREQTAVSEIRSLLSPSIQVYDLVGCTMHENIVWAHAIDLYLAHQGSIQHKVGWTANKPGVVHTNTLMLQKPLPVRPGCWERENVVMPAYVPQDQVTDIEEMVFLRGRWMKGADKNYECNWEALYQELVKIIVSLKR